MLIPTGEAAGGAGYTVLARRYRSRDFAELIGQEPIARTLQNAIKAGRTAHAYLFCGTRGVGKTSTARIFAKALNVTPDLAEADAIGRAILRGEDLDVIEIDAASNRGIDNARDLIANAGISPARCRYKIYIIDEVHMLTREAFNALLKTMEEPPSHVKFILCTTEAHKVPATIQSRCQRFDFRPISTQRIATHLKEILEQEDIEAEEEVVMQVARLGNGSMRDALSVLDRLLAAGEKKLTAELLEQMIGLPDYALVSELVDAIIAGDPRAALLKGDELINRGTSVEQGLELLTEHFRALMILAACGPEVEMLEMTAEATKAAEAQAQHFDAAGLVHWIAICDAVARSAKDSAAGRALFDAAIVRLSLAERFADVRAMLAGEAPEIVTTASSKKKASSAVATAAAHAEPQPTQAPPRQPAEAHPTHAPPAEPKPTQDALDGTAIWQRVQEIIGNESASVQARVDHLIYESCDGRTMRLSIDESGQPLARMLRDQNELVADLIKRATGCTLNVEIDAEGAVNGNGAAHGAQPGPQCDQSSELRTIPIVRHAIDVFDATIVSVEDVK